jgi:RNA polymerase sigma-70 factor (ECF subfamily)
MVRYVDEDLIDLARSAADGDEQAFATIVRKTQTDVWRFCGYLVDRQSADDLTQDTYLRAHQGLRRFRGDAPLRSWLLSIARRVCAAEIDARQRRRELALTVEALMPRTVPDSSGTVDIDLLISALPVERRVAFVLTAVVGLDYAEAARVCEVPIGTIRSRVSRGRLDQNGAVRRSSQVGVASTRR